MISEVSGRPTFTLGGQKWTCRSKLPWRKFIAYMSSLEDIENNVLERVEEFFSFALVQPDRERFTELLNSDNEDDEKVVSPSQVNAILEWLLEYYQGKAEKNQENSSDGPQRDGQSLSVPSLPAQTTKV